MEILTQSFGEYQTNCYICRFEPSELDTQNDAHKKHGAEIVIDPGIDAHAWVLQNAPNPLAILNTHGHFDHIWSNAALKNALPNTPLICHALDHFMLMSDCFGLGMQPSVADRLVEVQKDEEVINLSGIEVKFLHFPGHTPGCCIIEIKDCIFSGDFIFHRSIGRYDFPYSSPEDMRDSLLRFSKLPSEKDKVIYPGHGESTSLSSEQQNAKMWIAHIEREIA